MSEFDEHFRFRDGLTERLRLDVLGPVDGEKEVLTDPPINTYLTGVLFPQRVTEQLVEDSAEADADLADARLDKDEQPDTGVALANVQSPSSMGLTFSVEASCRTLDVKVEAAVYEPVDEAGNSATPSMLEARTTDESTVRWRRRPFQETRTIDLSADNRLPVVVVDGLELRVRVRPVDPLRDTIAVTVTLVNVHTVEGGALRDPRSFFQCELEVRCDSAIVEQLQPMAGDDDDTLLAALLYRHAPTFATGHGCAAEWDDHAESDTVTAVGAVSRVRSSFVPTFDVLLSESNTDIDTAGLRMIDIADRSTGEVVAGLRRLVDGYHEWVKGIEARAVALENTQYAAVALEQARQCRTAHDRMNSGIALLDEDPQVMRAFQLANRAMAMQRAQTLLMRDGTPGQGLTAGRWYPFQIGFILLCLRGIADPQHQDRGVADLLWFPTGGGKTEAYLGLVAFSTFLRRLRHGVLGSGVTVLMRYTLRLLTLQQFERAATLICAMEKVRQDQPDMPGEEISIGMWVGRSATPNSLADAKKALAKLAKGETLATMNPVQLRRCPWCGTDIDEVHYRVDDSAVRLVVACGTTGCHFRDGLPVHLVDQAVYTHRPTLIIATVDKFAQITWKPEPAALVNRAGEPEGTPPPELIIQDELHLISGPLGTLVGLYESALDIAAARPKVIASTATIRRAQEQGRALFDRDVHQFPPSGLDARNSWFAVEAPAERKPSRRYVGLFAPGTSQASLLVRAYGALLHHASRLDGKDEVRDPYWTLLGYFNSLRLLAAAELQVNDDVTDRLRLLAGENEPREVTNVTELTSRASASEIPRRLRQLYARHPDPDSLDVVLATNMISVGVDVDRLGLMAVTGQPQTTAEYIQSTSRVGRQYPGVVVVLYNAARSRDRSHYERFRSYHSALYRQVESTSVTPFSARARDRALHAALIGAARLTLPAARDNDGAARLDDFETELRSIADHIVDRARRVAPDEADGTAYDLDEILGQWRDMLGSNPSLLYQQARAFPGDTKRRPDYAALLRQFEDDDLPWSFATMNSLRDVDVETNLLPREER
ncbi:helicase-related protein [Paractinoplanes maris]|uniref:helicase-related protein n=1 Tax=Paractinoplanes maris TaxID=1734446 RepID=UPI0020227648|nr:helicase-related protein [Actinoplanes maris]